MTVEAIIPSVSVIRAETDLKVVRGYDVGVRQARDNAAKISAALGRGQAVVLSRGAEYAIGYPGIYTGRFMSCALFTDGMEANAPVVQVSSLFDKTMQPGAARLTHVESDLTYDSLGDPGLDPAVLHVRCGSFVTIGVEYRGRAYTTDSTSEGAIDNPQKKAAAGIAFQSPSSQPLSSNHVVSSCSFSEVERPLWFTREEWDPRSEHSRNESNNDNVLVWNPLFSNCGAGLVLDNMQSVGFAVHKPVVFGFGGRALNDFSLVKANRGGDVDVYSPSLNHQRCSIFESGAFDPDSAGFNCHGGRWDHSPDPTSYVSFFKYSGITWVGMQDVRYRIRVSGFDMNNMHVDHTWDPSKSIQVPLAAANAFPLDDIYVDARLPLDVLTLELKGLPQWERVGGGPYFRPRYTS